MRQNLKDVVAAGIRDGIFSGELAPGARIDQDALAERWEVSRLPIREAMIALESEGLIRIAPRRGAFVASLTSSEIVNHYHIYGLISGYATELATPRLTDDDLAVLRGLNDDLETAQDPAVQERVNFRFHQLIGAACGSARVRAVLRTLGRSMPGKHFDMVPGWRDASHDDHVLIFQALARRDAQAAGAAMLLHLDRGAEAAASAMEAAWRQRGDAV